MMASRRWTLLVVSEDETSVRQIHVTREIVRASIAGALLLVSLLISFAVGFFAKGDTGYRAHRLAEKNRLLATEVSRMRTQIATLRGSLDRLARQDEHFRLLAGLEPLDPEVQQAGIGGPGTATLETSPLFRVDAREGRRVFEVAGELDGLVRKAQLLTASYREATTTLEGKIARLAATPSILPTRGHFSSSFSKSRWHPILDRPRPHQGIDISAPRGTPIVATAKGRVIFAGRSGEYGLMVEIDHGYGYVTRYAHAARILVRPGQTVERGGKIGEVGDTGLAIGPHLHYEVLVNGRASNPTGFIFAGDVVAD